MRLTLPALSDSLALGGVRNADDEFYCCGLNKDGQQGTGSYNPEFKLLTF